MNAASVSEGCTSEELDFSRGLLREPLPSKTPTKVRFVVCSTTEQAAEKLLALKGHGFSRAVKAAK